MTDLLVSIKNLHEADIAVDAGVTILDVKEPTNGPLGRANWETIDAIGKSRRHGKSQPSLWSIALGELCDWSSDAAADFEKSTTHFDLVKFGLAGATSVPWGKTLQTFTQELPHHLSLVPVAYADSQQANSPPVDDVIEFKLNLSTKHRNEFLLIDTFTKQRGSNLLSFVSIEQLSRWSHLCSAHGVTLCIAGSLTAALVPELLTTGAGVIGIRSAACNGQRTDLICKKKIQQFQEQLSRTTLA